MYWIFKIRKQYRIFGTFAFVFFILILLGLYTTSGIEKITRSFGSMYADRLVPSMDLANVLIDVYENRVSLENHISEKSIEEKIKIERTVLNNHKAIDSIIANVSNTYLVSDERTLLAEFRANFKNYKNVEKDILNLSNGFMVDSALQLMSHKGNVIFHQVIKPLQGMEMTQKKVGHELYEDSLSVASRVKVVSYSIMIAAVMAAIFLGLGLTYLTIDQSSKD
jgi:CHASE3 domain sensor protein